MFKKDTVSSIIGDFEKKVVQLTDLAARHRDKIKDNKTKITVIENDNKILDAEQIRAYAVAGKINELIGA